MTQLLDMHGRTLRRRKKFLKFKRRLSKKAKRLFMGRKIYLARSLIVYLVLLSGCATYSETFDCPAGSGVGCKSLSRVNQMVEDGTLPYEEDGVSCTSCVNAGVKGNTSINNPQKPNQAIKNLNSPLHLYAAHHKNPNTPFADEQHMRIWLAGYEDKQGNYHSPSYVYTKPAQNNSDQLKD